MEIAQRIDFLGMERLRIKPGQDMRGYVSIHKMVDREILASIPKYRIYACPHGFISEGFFNNGQLALDATFALMASLSPPYIDYILDTRFSDPWPHDIFQLWKEKALETFAKYPQVHAVGVANEDSPLWLQISEWRQLFDKHGDRILGTFDTPEEAEAFLDKLRNIKSS
jgi:hypothetical protein